MPTQDAFDDRVIDHSLGARRGLAENERLQLL
jgi:hypothetical protein